MNTIIIGGKKYHYFKKAYTYQQLLTLKRNYPNYKYYYIKTYNPRTHQHCYHIYTR